MKATLDFKWIVYEQLYTNNCEIPYEMEWAYGKNTTLAVGLLTNGNLTETIITAEEIETVMKTSSSSPNFKAHTVLYE